MSNNTSYDKALLDEAPEVTREQRQRFYDTDLLQDDATRQRAAGGTDVVPGGQSNTDLEAGHGVPRSKEYASLPPQASRTSSKTPWYKTRKGIIGLVILAVVIVAAVIGGAVGGTEANKSNNDDADSSAASESASQLPPSISVAPTDTSSEGAEQGSGTIGVASATTTAPPEEATGTAGIATGPASTSTTPPTEDDGSQPSSDGVAVAAVGIVGRDGV